MGSAAESQERGHQDLGDTEEKERETGGRGLEVGWRVGCVENNWLDESWDEQGW